MEAGIIFVISKIIFDAQRFRKKREREIKINLFVFILYVFIVCERKITTLAEILKIVTTTAIVTKHFTGT